MTEAIIFNVFCTIKKVQFKKKNSINKMKKMNRAKRRDERIKNQAEKER